MKMVIDNLVPTVRNRKCPTHLKRAKGLWFINLNSTGWLLKMECTFPTTAMPPVIITPPESQLKTLGVTVSRKVPKSPKLVSHKSE